jgi:iron complex transport system substrate-binding protein
MKRVTRLSICLLLIVMTGCKNRGQQIVLTSVGEARKAQAFVEPIKPKYAKGFQVTYVEEGCLVEIRDPQSTSDNRSFLYFLIPRGTIPKQVPKDYTLIEVPVRSVICMTSLQLSNFIKLDELGRVVGITSTRYLFNEEINHRLEDGRTRKIGIEGNFDNEVIMGVNPDVILISPFKRGGYDAVKEVDIPLIPHTGYKEMSPLGQAEWIKFVGLLTGTEEKANSCFDEIERRYNGLKELTSNVKDRPVVFSGEMRGGNWYAVGGKSFLAQLFKDAGADYFLKDNQESGGVVLDLETVYFQAADARYWRIVNSYQGTFTYDVLKKNDDRYADFRAFKEKGIIYCNMREKPFYERMPVEPELILADLIKIFHPQLLPEDYKPAYYELLK